MPKHKFIFRCEFHDIPQTFVRVYYLTEDVHFTDFFHGDISNHF